LDPTFPAAPQFKEDYTHDFIFKTKADENNYHLAPAYQQEEKKKIASTDTPVIILKAPVNPDEEDYIVQEVE